MSPINNILFNSIKEDEKTVILHATNDVGAYDKDFLGEELANEFPKTEKCYLNWYRSKNNFGLGEAQYIKIKDNLYVINLITETGFRTKTNLTPLDREALKSCLQQIKDSAILKDAVIKLSKNDFEVNDNRWKETFAIIEEELKHPNIEVFEVLNEKQKYAQDYALVSKIPIIEYAKTIGLTPVRKGRHYSLEEADSVMIDPEVNLFKRFSKYDVGGGVVQFAMEFYNGAKGEPITKQEAMLHLLEEVGINPQFSIDRLKEFTYEPVDTGPLPDIELPEKDNTVKNVYAYLLKTRMIDKEVIDFFLRNGYLYQDVRKNCVWVTRDENGKPNFASLRNTGQKPFRLDLPGCNYNEGFFIKGTENDVLFATEAIIDMMSAMCIINHDLVPKFNWLSINGTCKIESIFEQLKKNPSIKTLILGFDSDEAGINAALNVKKELNKLGWPGEIKNLGSALPEKDWNEVLIQNKKKRMLEQQKQQPLSETVNKCSMINKQQNAVENKFKEKKQFGKCL